MIFKSIDNDSNNISENVGKLAKLFNLLGVNNPISDFKKIFSPSNYKYTEELGERFKTLKSEAGEKHLSFKEYIGGLNGVPDEIRYFIQTTKEANPTLDDFKKSLSGINIGSKIAAAGLNFLSSAIISIAVDFIYTAITRADDLANAAEAAGQAYKETASNLDSYASEIESLRNTINDHNSSLQEVTDSRTRLREIQDEMISKYGSEVGAIDNITKAVQGQTDAIEENIEALKKQQYEKEMDNLIANESGGFLYKNSIGNLLNYGTASPKKVMIKQMEDFEIKIPYVGGYEELEEKFKEIIKNNLGEFDEENPTLLKGTAKDVYATIDDLETALNDYIAKNPSLKSSSFFDGVSDQLSSAASETNEISSKYEELYNSYLMFEKILPNGTYKGYYEDIEEEYNKHQEAINSGDSKKAEEAFQNYVQKTSEATQKALDDGEEGVANFFKSLHTELEVEVNLSIHKKDINNDIKDALTDAGVLDKDGKITAKYSLEDLISGEGKYSELTDELKDLIPTYDINFETLQKLLEDDYGLKSKQAIELADKFKGEYQKEIEELSNQDLTTVGKIDLSYIETWDELIERIEKYNQLMAQGNEEDAKLALITNKEKQDTITGKFTRKVSRETESQKNQYKKDNPSVSQKELNKILGNPQHQLDEFEKWINSLDSDELNLVYKISLDDESAYYSLEQWQKAFDNAQKTKSEQEMEYLSTILNSTEDGSFGKQYQEAIKDLDTLQDALQKFNAGELSSSDKQSLIEQFPVLTQYENFGEGISAQINTLLGDAERETGLEQLFKEKIAELTKSYGEDSELVKALTKIKEELFENYKISQNSDGSYSTTSTRKSDIISKYTDQLNEIDHTMNVTNNEIDKLKVQENYNVDEFYNELIEAAGKKKELLLQERNDLQALLSSGSVEVGTAEYNEIQQQIRDLDEQIIDADKSVVQYTKDLKDLQVQKFDKIKQEFDDQASLLDHEANMLNKQIEGIEKQGDIVDASQYETLIALEQQKISKLEQQLASLQQAMQNALNSGAIQEGDHEWYEMQKSINDTEESIMDAKNAIIDYNQAIKQIQIDKFDKIVEKFEGMASALDHQTSMLEKQVELLELRGETADASMYLSLIGIEQQKMALLNQELAELQSSLNEGLSNGSIQEGTKEFYDMQNQIYGVEESILDSQIAIEKFNQSIKDLYVDKFDEIERKFQSMTNTFDHQVSMMDKNLQLLELRGDTADASMYSQMQAIQLSKQATLEQELVELQAAMSDAIAHGVKETDEQYLSMQSTLYATEEAIMDCKIAVEEYNQAIKDLYVKKFEEIQRKFEIMTSSMSHQVTMLDKQIQLIEARGDDIDASMYSQMQALENQKMNTLEQQLVQLQAAMAEARANGITETDEQYLTMQNTLYETEEAIMGCKIAMEQYNQAIKDLYVKKFEEIQRKFEIMTSSMSHQVTMLDKQIQLIEARGDDIDASMYSQMQALENQKMNTLEQQLVQLQAAMAEARANGITETDEQYLTMQNTLYETEEAIMGCKIAMEQYNQAIKDLQVEKLEKIAEKFDNMSATLDHKINTIENKIKILELQGKDIDASMYEDMIRIEEQRTKDLEKELVELKSAMQEAIASGDITEGDEQWAQMEQTINDVEEAIQNSTIAALEFKEAIKDLYLDKFNKVAEKFDNELSLTGHKENSIKNDMDILEARGYMASEKSYLDLLKVSQTNLSQNQKKADKLRASLQEALDSGYIEKGSEQWYEMVKEINDADESVQDVKKSLIEYQNELRQLKWDKFDWVLDRMSKITDETEFLIKLMSDSDLFEDNGNITNKGQATLGLHAVAYNVDMTQADKYAKELNKITAQLLSDPYNTDLIARRDELLKLQQESILAAEDEKQAIKDLVEDGINKQLEATQELIDKRKEALSAEKELHDYQKNIREKTKEISSLEKQMAAYAGDDSEETKATIQKLKVSLEEAREDLSETEYDKYISDQEELLDNLYDEYEELLNARLDDVDALIKEIVESTNKNSEEIQQTISDVASEVGYYVTDEMKNIWGSSSLSTNQVVDVYGEGFLDKLTTTNSTLNNIQNLLEEMSYVNDKKVGSTIATIPAEKQDKDLGFITIKKTEDPNFDSSFATRAKYYKKAGYTDAYIDSAEQKRKVLAWLQKNGYAKGKKKVTKPEIKPTQEEGVEYILSPSTGAILTPLKSGDSVLTNGMTKTLWDFASNPSNFIRKNTLLNGTTQLTPFQNISKGGNIDMGGISLNIAIDHVQDYNDFVNQAIRDNKFEKFIRSITIDRLNGGNSLAKNKYRR